MDILFFIAALISFFIWLYLALMRGNFWHAQPQLTFSSDEEKESLVWPSVAVIIPARNEAQMLIHTLPTLLNQVYDGEFQILLVDDQSTDNTKERAEQISKDLEKQDRLKVISGTPLPQGWTGKLWAMNQGLEAAQSLNPDYFLFTDADIAHPDHSIKDLVEQALKENLHLVSVMVMLKVTNNWERLLIPAFVYFFSKLYPFSWVNAPCKTTAAAAGGCILVRAHTLACTGGLKPISHELIDDCALARQIKGSDKKPSIWLGLSEHFQSLRVYGGPKGVWHMVARTAYTELKYSPLRLLFTIAGMAVTYLIPPFLTVMLVYQFVISGGITIMSTEAGLIGFASLMMMSGTFIPMLTFYRTSPVFAFLLPFAGLLYTLMTLDSAFKHMRGKGGQWKGRHQSKDMTM